ncbi:MAG: hypothetical protein AB7O39_00060 [Flavobacteriaceae bacterium]
MTTFDARRVARRVRRIKAPKGYASGSWRSLEQDLCARICDRGHGQEEVCRGRFEPCGIERCRHGGVAMPDATVGIEHAVIPAGLVVLAGSAIGGFLHVVLRPGMFMRDGGRDVKPGAAACMPSHCVRNRERPRGNGYGHEQLQQRKKGIRARKHAAESYRQPRQSQGRGGAWCGRRDSNPHG